MADVENHHRLHRLDLVRFDPAGEGDDDDDERKHGELGLVVAYTEPKTKVMCIDGAVVDTDGVPLAVVDRSSLHPGMHVTSASDPAGQIGVVTAVSSSVDLVNNRPSGDYSDIAATSSEKRRGVSPATLRRVTEFSLGDYVVSVSGGGDHHHWLGRVVEICVAVDVAFDDGAVCRVTGMPAQSQIVGVGVAAPLTYRRREVNCEFYPGQRVTGHTSTAFKKAKWLRGYWKENRVVGTVVKVNVTSVFVIWIASAKLGTDKNLVNASAPPAQQNPQDLTIFCSDDECPWALGDRCFLPDGQRSQRRRPQAPAPTDDREDTSSPPPTMAAVEKNNDNDNGNGREASEAAVAAPGKGKKEMKPYRNQLRKFFYKRGKRGTRWGARMPAVEKTVVVAGTATTANVLWQDGTMRRGVASVELVPFNILNDHEFFPGQHVVVGFDHTMDAAAGEDAPAAARRQVGVVRSVDPKDQTVRVSWLDAGGGGEEEEDAVASAYDLRKYTEHDVFYGDVVIRLLPPPATPPGDEAKSVDLSWVGRVVDVRDGHVQVRWGDGETSTALHHEVIGVEMQRYWQLEYEVGPWLDDHETPPATAAAANNNNNVANVAGARAAGVNAPAPPPLPLPLTGRVRAAVQSVIDVASQLLAQGKSYLVSGSSSSSSAAAATVNDDAEAPPPAAPADGGDANVEDGNGSAAPEAEAADDAGAGDDDDPLGFAHFDVVQCPLDHHYLDSKLEGTAHGNKWVKRVQKEWTILGDDNLPGKIYVRAYEDRMDLLRAAMVGAAGTPYHDGLFLFDIHLPQSYPSSPPQVYYHSFGLRVNPNLYPSGTICLSLLGTFDAGEGVERWSPENSTLLQVLVSIQGLVLTVDPYYNEAGYDAYVGTPEGRRNAVSYAENAFLLTLRSTLHLLRRPLQGFEELVVGHFRRRGRHVLATCEAYLLQGVGVSGDRDAKACSAGFRLALGNIVPMLVEAFSVIGAEGDDQFT